MAELRPRDIAALAADTDRRRIVELLTGSYDDFCTCVVAEATRWVPTQLRRTLRRPQWLDDWIDALLGAEGDLQIAVFRARLEHGPHGERTISNSQALSAVRTRLHEARALAKERRRADNDGAGDVADPATRWATRRLVREHRAEYTRLVGEQLGTLGLDPDLTEDIPAGDAAIARWALAHQVDGIAASSSRVRQLLALTDDEFRKVVAADVQRDPAEPDLTHPLVLHRWEQALQHLARITTDLLGIELRPHAAVADADLSRVGVAGTDAYQRINQLRFLAHVRQRWLEHSTRARRLRSTVIQWREDRLHDALEPAREHLRQAHPSQYQALLAQAPTEPVAPPPAQPGPAATPAPRSTPQAMTAFRDRVEQLGWTVSIDQDDNQARLSAVLGRTAVIRLAYKRKNRGRASGRGWTQTRLTILVNGTPGWTPLPTLADALDLAAHPAHDLSQQIELYRQNAAPETRRRTAPRTRPPSS